jgi:hypothetical protein
MRSSTTRMTYATLVLIAVRQMGFQPEKKTCSTIASLRRYRLSLR